MLVTLLPIPQRYFLPRRIRESFRPRLEAVELWSPENVADEEEEERLHFSFRRFARTGKKDTIKREKRHKYAREQVSGYDQRACEIAESVIQVLKKARTFFDSYATLLGHSTFFYKSGRHVALADIDIIYLTVFFTAPPSWTSSLLHACTCCNSRCRTVCFGTSWLNPILSC